VTRILATYRVRANAADVEAAARALALEQSVELPREAIFDRVVLDDVAGRVESIAPLGEREFEVVIGLATETTGFDVAQGLNMLFGNSSLHDHIELVDVEFPAEFLARFPGPRFGIAGLRSLTGALVRPLTCAALKPQGLSSDALAGLCYTFAAGGIDVIKDDHGLADQRWAPFAQRVRACQRALERARTETGARALYAPSLVGAPKALLEQARIVRAEGVGMVLLAPALLGMPAFAELVAEQIAVPVLAHPAYAGAARVAPPLLLGRLFRLLGSDAVIYPNYGGRFSYSVERCAAIARACRQPWAGLRPAMPVPAGGMSVERVPELVQFYGQDAMLLVGGSLLAAGDALLARTREFVSRVADTSDG
jgi:ribulose-bisphosphate carboxylase large chain